MLGPIVMVQFESRAPVYLMYIALPGSVEPSAIVVVCVSAFVVIASVPNPKASPINSKLVFVDAPHVPLSAPSAISFNLKSFT